jgi:hypothetical protein
VDGLFQTNGALAGSGTHTYTCAVLVAMVVLVVVNPRSLLVLSRAFRSFTCTHTYGVSREKIARS